MPELDGGGFGEFASLVKRKANPRADVSHTKEKHLSKFLPFLLLPSAAAINIRGGAQRLVRQIGQVNVLPGFDFVCTSTNIIMHKFVVHETPTLCVNWM